jgi:hypothetical protein
MARRASDPALTTALRYALDSVGIEQPIRSVQRRENVYASSHLSDVLDCELEDGSTLGLVCKHGPSTDRNHLGLVRGLGYEANVYRSVLKGQSVSPRFYGSYDEPLAGRTWLFLEYLGDGWQLDLGPEDAIVHAAAMIGELHRAVAEPPRSLIALNRYDRRYFGTCLREARAVADVWRERVPAFDRMVGRLADGLELLLSAPQTFVHGELTPHNVVWTGDRTYAVDWEEAALAAGEIDVACLTDEWPQDLVELATTAYQSSRWPQGPPHDFVRTVQAARLYWLFRWLTDPDETGNEEELEWVTEQLSRLA